MEEEVFGADDGNVRAVSEAGRAGSGPQGGVQAVTRRAVAVRARGG